jgi:hypothetical protein
MVEIMTESAIKKLGFKKVNVTAEESGNTPYYFYAYKVGNIELISNSHDNLQEDSWIVEILEGDIQFTTSADTRDLITLLERNKLQ